MILSFIVDSSQRERVQVMKGNLNYEVRSDYRLDINLCQ